MTFYNLPDAHSLAHQYASAKPFPHIVIPDFLNPAALDAILEEIQPDAPVDVHYQGMHEEKYVTCDRNKLGTAFNAVCDAMNSDVFVTWLNTVTCVESPLIADHKLMGGGFHELKRGGHLAIHADFNRHYETGYHRRVNLLLYLNKDWKDEYGGHLELWDRDMSACHVRVRPDFNTCVIFNTTDFSFHGNPDPVTCQPNMSRKSIALYYYSKTRPAHEINPEAHNSIFKSRPGIDPWPDLIT